MANTYSQIYIQVVFAVQNKGNLIGAGWKDELYMYITGIVQNRDHKILQINGVEDHIHIFISMHPNQSVSDLVKVVKAESTKWINTKGFISQKFAWQGGFGVFSYSKDHVPVVVRYIQNQEEHHKKVSFNDEYRSLLKEHDIEFDERYILKT